MVEDVQKHQTLFPNNYTPHEPPGWNEYIDDAFVAPAGSPYFLPQDSSFNMSETFVEPTQEERIVNWIGDKWDEEKSHLRNEFGIPSGSGPYRPTSWEGITNLYNNLEFPKFSRTRKFFDQFGKGLHDTGKLFYDHGMYSDDILDFFGWQPQDNYYNESMNERFNEDYISDEMSMLGLQEAQMAQSQWKKQENMEKTIKALEIRPEFEGWTHDEIKYWIINQARANRGGIIGLI